MRRFVDLYQSLDATTRTNDKVDALVEYFTQVDAKDAAWAAYLLACKKLGKAISSRRLRNWVSEVTGYDPWLVEECYQSVGDLSETLALLLPSPAAQSDPSLHTLIEDQLLPMLRADEVEQKHLVLRVWNALDAPSRFLFHKLLSTNFRVGVSRTLLVRALARVAGIEPGVMEHRMSAKWKPTPGDYLRLVSSEEDGDVDLSRPYPFLLASPLENGLESLGPIANWQLEWKWDGIRAQLIQREGHTFLVSRGEEHVATAFPEVVQLGAMLPGGTALDGEILAYHNEKPLPFNALQRRLNRKNVELMLFTDVPVVFLAYDIMEHHGKDVRSSPLSERRSILESIVSTSRDLKLSPIVSASGWDEIDTLMSTARDRGVEGLMIKRRESAYEVGRPRGVWWKLKVAPYTLDCVLIAAQPGSGKRAGLFTDYTFAVRDGETFVTIAKAYSGLTDDEIGDVDRWIRAHITGRYGPVRSVTPELIFELGFEGIAESDRHKSGIALRFPRMLRWRKDKPLAEIDTLETARALLVSHTT